jgi:hypothetical protein
MSSIKTEDEGKTLSEVALAAIMEFTNAEVDKLVNEMMAQFKKGVYPVEIQSPDDHRVVRELLARLSRDKGLYVNAGTVGDKKIIVKLVYYDPRPQPRSSDYD